MSADGSWKVSLSTPMGAQEMNLELTTDGDALKGSMSGPTGAMDITDGSVNGNELKWKAAIEQPMAMTLEFVATLDGDNLSGNAALGSFGSASFTGSRA